MKKDETIRNTTPRKPNRSGKTTRTGTRPELTITKDGLDELMETVMAVIDEETYDIYNNAYYDGFHTAYRILKNRED